MSRLAPGLLAARAVGALARRAGRGGGTSLPGKVLTRVEPRAIGLLSERLAEGSVVLSATNGKTTTAAMIASILERRGTRLVHNRAGANMAGGIAATLAAAARRGGREVDGTLGLFEVDEFWVPQLVEQLRPRALLLANLFRDQLDRYGELETIADRWAEVVGRLPPATALVLNADDPLVADLPLPKQQPKEGQTPFRNGGQPKEGQTPFRYGAGTGEPIYFGVEDDSLAQAELQHASDSKHCRRCGHPYAYDAIYLGHLGRYHCPNCGARRPRPSVRATSVELRGIRSAAFTLHLGDETERIQLPLPGLYNVYNALGAAALCSALGVGAGDVAAGLQAVAPAFGRAETVELRGRRTSLLLVKNPAGANEVLRTLALEPGQLDILGVLNDRIADGRDVSWVWDADWEILAPRLRRMTCAGTRAAELAVRLKYAGVDPQRVHVEEDLGTALDAALGGGDGPLHVLPTYTALLELKSLLADRGEGREFYR